MPLAVSRKALDNLGVRFRDRCEQVGDRGLIQDYRLFRSEDLSAGFEAISKATSRFPALLSGRLKRTDTLIRKLRREKSMKLTFMDDIVGFRILVASPLVQQQVTRALKDSLPTKLVKDYVNAPPDSGYQGIHVICQMAKTFPGNETPSNLTYEIQVRTHYQHIWSTTSESMGEQVKEGGGTETQRAELAILGERVRTFELANPAFIQSDTLSNNSPPTFFVMNYDKAKGRTVMIQTFQSDLSRALEYYKYLEDEFSRNLNSEIVLLAGPDESLLRTSHMRYYRPKGRPTIPGDLKEM
jgi:ppGpp synthetase/RelA/SpoT-type nucleotidyltranferase